MKGQHHQCQSTSFHCITPCHNIGEALHAQINSKDDSCSALVDLHMFTVHALGSTLLCVCLLWCFSYLTGPPLFLKNRAPLELFIYEGADFTLWLEVCMNSTGTIFEKPKWYRMPHPLSDSCNEILEVCRYDDTSATFIEGPPTCYNMSFIMWNVRSNPDTGSYNATLQNDCGSCFALVFHVSIVYPCSIAPPSARFSGETEKRVYAASAIPLNITFNLEYLGCTNISKYAIVAYQSGNKVCEDTGLDAGSRYTCTREPFVGHFIETVNIRNYSIADNGLYCFQPQPQELNLTTGVQVCPLHLSKLSCPRSYPGHGIYVLGYHYIYMCVLVAVSYIPWWQMSMTTTFFLEGSC